MTLIRNEVTLIQKKLGFGSLETFRLFRLTSFLLREPKALFRETFCFLIFNCQPKALNRKSEGFCFNRIEDSLNNSIGILNNQNLPFFAANDVHEGGIGGIGVAVASRPEGPYKDLLGKPLINEIVNGAQRSYMRKMDNIICIMVDGDIVMW